jgi:pyruvate ferredoxin oxidoreductase gamma subunit
MVDVTKGVKNGGIFFINTQKSKNEVMMDLNLKPNQNEVYTIDATKIALDILGVPIVNTVMLGAFAGVTKEISLEALKKATQDRLKGEIGRKNIIAIEAAYNEVTRC